ncbi:DUF1574 family protein [Leptospira idonii]|uniref:DUF1574 domain-containing protein n=1 Tax=Leptospira idonii TaxID=1193500 RepID=A0A4R9LU97_9LEPT|nr:DUF1574 family protein [Leptospira idonii]TGN17375.1 DUF1574 domain-containing protein [Leptospira idonii]
MNSKSTNKVWKQWIWWKPIAVFVLFLAFDRLLTIPYLRNRVTNYKSVDLTLAEVSSNGDPVDYEKEKDGTKQVWALGTSRSKAFNAFPDPAYSKMDPFLTEEEKKKMGEWKGKAISFPGGSFLNFYTRFYQLLERGYKPDFVFIEISPGSFNRNSLINIYSKQEGLSIPYALSHYNRFETETIARLFVTRTFLSYRYQFNFTKFFDFLQGKEGKAPLLEKALKDMNIDPNELNRNSGVRDTIDQYLSADGKAHFDDDFDPNPSTNLYAIKYMWMVNELQRTIYSDFIMDYEQLEYVSRIIDVLNERNIPFIFWKPKFHSVLDPLENNEFTQKLYSEVIIPKITEKGATYIDASKLPLKCNYYQDAAHYSSRCYTELAKEILKAAGK